MKKRLISAIFPLLLLTGCGSEGFADRVYTRGIGLSGTLRMSIQGFEEEGCTTVEARDLAEALRKQEAEAGGKVFVGHTELLCLDGSSSPDEAAALFFEESLSPGCKVLCASPEAFFRSHDCAEAVHSLRMAERTGLLPMTELATVLEEWLGSRRTALLPARDGKAMVLLRTDGSTVALSQEAAAGMRWLRRNTAAFTMTVGREDLEITRIRRHREAGETIRYCITVQTKDTDAQQRRLLREQIQAECDAALTEMLAAGADVIGLEELCRLHGLETEPFPPVTAEVTVQ